MEKNDKNNNNFRTLSGGSEKSEIRDKKNIPDNYADVLAGDNHHPVRSESSYDNSGLTGSQEELGLTGSGGMNTSVGQFGQKGILKMHKKNGFFI